MFDSVPAPMVQVPAEPGSVISAKPPGRKKAFLMALTTDGWWQRLDVPIVEKGPFRDVSVLFDAATPAASVPAADILALADEMDGDRTLWHVLEAAIERATGPASGADAAQDAAVEWLRALVAAAEQADKGEAAEPPRDEPETAKDKLARMSNDPDYFTDALLRHRKNVEAERAAAPAAPPEPTRPCSNGRCSREFAHSGPCLDSSAAPPEPLCRCGHGKSEHAQGSFSCGRVIEGSGCELHVCSCSVFRYGSRDPARVPVNDEAEAAWQAWVQESKDRNYTVRDVFVDGYLQAKADASVESTITRAARGEDDHG